MPACVKTIACVCLPWLIGPFARVNLLPAAELPYRVGKFEQEVAVHRGLQDGLPSRNILRVGANRKGRVVVETDQGCVVRRSDQWRPVPSFPEDPQMLDLPDRIEPVQIATTNGGNWIAVASARGLWEHQGDSWSRVAVNDGLGRRWANTDVRGVAYDQTGRLWFATLAGVGCREADGTWRLFEGRDGLPYNDFTCVAAGPDGSVWFGTTKGAIRFSAGKFGYRQGLRWLPDDDVREIYVDPQGTAWLATSAGVGCIERRSMRLSRKAAIYEDWIDRLHKRTRYGFVNSVTAAAAGDMSDVTQHASDNDGLWTSMYGASQCYAFAVTGSQQAQERAKQAFEALRFLQKVTQGGRHSPPRGYVARSVLPVSGPDPNQGRFARDRRARATQDRLWKVYTPRWPKSADEEWYWKSDTSSDELDGHYFFYALYYDLVAGTPGERDRVRDVVRELTDHFILHDYVLLDHDGTPTRWGMFRPSVLNHDFYWHQERGINSLSMLSYLAVAEHITGELRYREAAERLRREHSYDMNALVPKMQRGMGSGNQSDDEMAFMSFYSLIRYTPEGTLRNQYLSAFYSYWMLEQPERNPLFNFMYAAVGRGASVSNSFQTHSLSPWGDWLEDSVATLEGFPLDRFDWAHTNSHRIDLVELPRQQSNDYLGTIAPTDTPRRGYRIDGKVLPVEERYFSHWNHDPWRLDYAGSGRSLGCGSVFLLPYYMGLYHGFIE